METIKSNHFRHVNGINNIYTYIRKIQIYIYIYSNVNNEINSYIIGNNEIR